MDDKSKAITDFLQLFEKIIKQGPWESSAFLRGVGSKLKQIYANCSTKLIDLMPANSEEFAPTDKQVVVLQKMEVFIPLYQAQGLDLNKWMRVINVLLLNSVNRPVFKDENQVKLLLRDKKVKINEGYVVVQIGEEDILNIPFKAVNRSANNLGYDTLILKSGAIKLKNIFRFMHMNQTYLIKNGNLVLQTELPISSG